MLSVLILFDFDRNMAMGSSVNLWFFALISLMILSVSQSTEEEKEIPLTKINRNFNAPTLKFLYCYSCGYRKMFDEYASILNQKYPLIMVDGANYDPPGMNMLLSRFIGLAKILVIMVILSGLDIFGRFGQITPSWWTWCIENKLYACMMLFFLCNIIEGHLISSGAFEIFLNDVPVWSKLETGRIPQPAELFQIIENHLQFTESKVELKPGFAK